ncbi:ArsR/SmtB family transcription factor [Symbiobacterium terraclitae]|uniref:ArsR/SmtB family transcription factor n=1 Tax=Symbiobacterium terraclitae TaxID=557451 RepID=UPI0035B55623
MEKHVILMKALADSTRLKLLKLIWDQERCVCELQPILGISQPAVSQHIAKLKAAGLVKERRAGMWVYYQANRSRLLEGLEAFKTFLDADLATIPELAGTTFKGCC